MNEEFFAPKPTSGLRSFDAFPKTSQTYRIRSSRGGGVTVLLLTLCTWLAWREFVGYLDGTEAQTFTVEPGVGHSMQINLDITVAMPCAALHVNVQDAAMDRILAANVLTEDPTSFDDTSAHRLVPIGDRPDHVYEVLRKARKSKFGKTHRRTEAFIHRKDRKACRIYGSMPVNRVQGDFHITAKGHGYEDFGSHVEHNSFNFSHVINELSFGELYPKLVNPLDGVVATTEENFYKFQYYLSIVPTTYASQTAGRTVHTNQYAVTEQSRAVNKFMVPGIFFKFDIEPLSLTVTEDRTPFLRFVIRLVNVLGGVLVSGNWIYSFAGWAAELLGRKARRGRMEGVITGKAEAHDD